MNAGELGNPPDDTATAGLEALPAAVAQPTAFRFGRQVRTLSARR